MTEDRGIKLNSSETDMNAHTGDDPKMREPEDLGEIEGIEGHWVVVLKGKVIASSENGGKMAKLAMKYPPEDACLTFIPFHDASFY